MPHWFSDIWVPKLLFPLQKIRILASKRQNSAQYMHFWSFWAKYWLFIHWSTLKVQTPVHEQYLFFSVTAKAWYGCVIACYSILLLGIVWLVECSALFLAQCIALFLSGVASSHRWFKHSIMGNTLIHSFSITGYRVLSIIYCHYKHLLGKGCRKKHKIFRTFAIYGGQGVSPPKCFFF